MHQALVLVRHSISAARPGIPGGDWPLSDRGLQACPTLASALQVYSLSRVVSSSTVRTIQTAIGIAEPLALPFHIRPRLYEHDRTGVPFTDVATFRRSVAHFFAKPGEIVFGTESAETALRRFDRAVEAVCAEFKGETLAIVSHGTVISLFWAAKTGSDALDLWRRLQMPAYIAFRLPDFEVLESRISLK